MAIVIGLTGGIATGKSTISQMFRAHNIPVIDADTIAKQVCEMNEPAYYQIVDHFGEEILLVTGHISRKKLSAIVFEDETKRSELNQIVHPEVKKVIMNQLKRYTALEEPYVVVDVPLLFESGFDSFCDYTLVVFTDEETQLERLMNRDNLTKEEANSRIKAQMNLGEKLRRADFMVDNSLSILETRKQFDQFMRKLKEGRFNK